MLKLKKWVQKLAKLITGDPRIRPTLASLHIKNGYLYATDSFCAIKTKQEGFPDCTFSVENYPSEEVEFKKTENDVKLKGKAEYTMKLMSGYPDIEKFFTDPEKELFKVDVDVLYRVLTVLKQAEVRSVTIHQKDRLSAIQIYGKSEKECKLIESIVMPMK